MESRLILPAFPIPLVPTYREDVATLVSPPREEPPGPAPLVAPSPAPLFLGNLTPPQRPPLPGAFSSANSLDNF